MTSELPFLTESEPISGALRTNLEDFQVEEVPAYTPSGTGEHLFVRFEKRDLATREAVRRIAAALGVDPRDAGWAGMKDRRAVTTQWASFHRGDPARARDLALEGIRILEALPHVNKLRTGHLKGNRFSIVIRGLPEDRLPAAQATLATLVARGAPSYFGPQRFGRDGRSLHLARSWIVDGGRAPRAPFERKMLVSVLQAALFNEVLAARIRDGLFAGAVPGDLYRKEETGGLFTTTDLDDARARLASFAISPTGPMFGAKMRWPEDEARRREEGVLEAAGLDQAKLRSFAAAGEGTRRPLRIPVHAATLEPVPGGARLEMELPAGAFATVVIRELLHADPASDLDNDDGQG